MTNYKNSTLIFLFLTLLNLFSSNLLAAGNADDLLFSVARWMLWFTIALIVMVLWLALVYSEKNDLNGEIFKRAFRKSIYLINPMPAIEKENDILLNHDYDGIKELDNVVPPWFNFLFYGSIIIGIIYMFNFHILNSQWSSEKEYSQEMEIARAHHEVLVKSGVFIDENSVQSINDPATILEGKEIFQKNCVTCHGQNGEGLVGPNLTDQFWINGGGIKNIFSTVKYGVPAKGMIPWQTQLNPKQMQSVSNYIISLFGTNPSNAKAPEGEKWLEPVKSDNGKI